MQKIEEKYKQLCLECSDINEHLPVLLKYGKECEHITEMGVRKGVSTWAFLLSAPLRFVSYDIYKTPEINDIIDTVRLYNINYSFIETDVLIANIEQTELLFIDTLHTYNQLTKELTLHSKACKKYIILHDTTTYEYNDESVVGYTNLSPIVKDTPLGKQGLWAAVTDFLTSDIGKDWKVHERYTNNNGLTVLKRHS